MKKSTKFQTFPENLSIDLYQDYLSPIKGDEEVKLEPVQTIAKRVKLNPKKKTGTVLKILMPKKLSFVSAQ